MIPQTQVFNLIFANQIQLQSVPAPGTLILSMNGVDQTAGKDYTIAGAVITFLFVDPANEAGINAHWWTAAAVVVAS